MKIEIEKKKIVISVLLTFLLMVIAPIIIFDVIEIITGFPMSKGIPKLLASGTLSTIVAGIRSMFKPGTRPHGFVNIIFAVVSAYNLYMMLGGAIAEAGTITVSTQSVTLHIQIGMVFYVLMLVATLQIVLYLFELIVPTEEVNREWKEKQKRVL